VQERELEEKKKKKNRIPRSRQITAFYDRKRKKKKKKEEGRNPMELEQPLLQVVGANLNNVFRSYTQVVEKELLRTSAAVQQLATQAEKLSPGEARQQVEALVGRLKGLKRKVSSGPSLDARRNPSSPSSHLPQLQESRRDEEKEIARCKARLEHLGGHPQARTSSLAAAAAATTAEAAVVDQQAWLEQRTNRFVADHMLRSGFLASAESLAAEAHIEVPCCCCGIP